jgi:Glutathione-dependent formaldehyde-activating enzyme
MASDAILFHFLAQSDIARSRHRYRHRGWDGTYEASEPFSDKRPAAMRIDGSCHCGDIRIEGDADPEKTTICHCTDCQAGTGSAFRVSVPVPGGNFRMVGQPTTYLKTTAESGKPRL